jgi:aminopeptidase N
VRHEIVEIMTQMLIKLIQFSEFSNVVPSDLYKVADEVYESQHGAGMDSFDKILGSWANQKGFPLVTVSHETQQGVLHINQRQFWSDPKQPTVESSW